MSVLTRLKNALIGKSVRREPSEAQMEARRLRARAISTIQRASHDDPYYDYSLQDRLTRQRGGRR